MTKMLQRKFVFTAMIAITGLLIIVLGAINIFNAKSIIQRSDRLLDDLARMDDMPPPKSNEKPGNSVFNPALTDNDRMAAIYFSVRLSNDNQIDGIDMSRIASINVSEAKNIFEKAFNSGQTTGEVDGYKFKKIVLPDGDKQKCVFLDISNEVDSIVRVVVLSGLIGLICWSGMLLLVYFLSKKAIKPIAENLERQKQFVNDAGHEIKTPLAIILANTEAMELFQGENKWSKNIKNQTLRLNGLMQSLLSFGKIEENNLKVPVETVDVSSLLREQLEMFSTLMQLRGLTAQANIDSDILYTTQEEQITQLISILIDNAGKYALENSSIDVFLKKSDNYFVLRISNLCQQLPDCTPEKLFDRFYRGDSARTQKSGGFGIGLAMAKTIVDNIGGKLNAVYEDNNRISFIWTVKC